MSTSRRRWTEHPDARIDVLERQLEAQVRENRITATSARRLVESVRLGRPANHRWHEVVSCDDRWLSDGRVELQVHEGVALPLETSAQRAQGAVPTPPTWERSGSAWKAKGGHDAVGGTRGGQSSVRALTCPRRTTSSRSNTYSRSSIDAPSRQINRQKRASVQFVRPRSSSGRAGGPPRWRRRPHRRTPCQRGCPPLATPARQASEGRCSARPHSAGRFRPRSVLRRRASDGSIRRSCCRRRRRRQATRRLPSCSRRRLAPIQDDRRSIDRCNPGGETHVRSLPVAAGSACCKQGTSRALRHPFERLYPTAEPQPYARKN
jgi:hypothetical protein